MNTGFPWWILIPIVILGVVVYLFFMIFFPEWVGITGKTALENERSHRAEKPDESPDESPDEK